MRLYTRIEVVEYRFTAQWGDGVEMVYPRDER